MQLVTREELEKIKSDAEASGKDVSEIEKILAQKKFSQPPMGEMKVIDVSRDVWKRMDERSKRTKVKGKVVIMSTGPAREDDFE
jgi:hypothetical protein